MAGESLTIYVYYIDCSLNIEIIDLLEKKCEKFVNRKVALVKYPYDSDAGLVACDMLSDMRKVRKNRPKSTFYVFLLSKMFLDSIWCTKHKKHILDEFMLQTQSLMLLMDDVTHQVLQKYSTRLSHRRTAKLSIDKLKCFRGNELESYFNVNEHFLSMSRFKASGKFCVQKQEFV